MASGFYLMYRGWMENAVFSREPFTECQAWIWLIERAAWDDAVHSVGRKRIKVERGQVAVSVRYLAEAWQWKKSRVSRFLERLKIGTMIGTVTETEYTLITICNYRAYQDMSRPPGTPDGTDVGTRAGHERDKYNDKPLNQVNQLAAAREPAPDDGSAAIRPPDIEQKRLFVDWLLPYLDVPATFPLDRLRMWLTQGATLEQIRLAIELATGRNREEDPTWRPRGLKYFDGIIGDVVAGVIPTFRASNDNRDSQGISIAAVQGQWQQRVSSFKASGFWMPLWGDQPDQPDCLAPPAVLREYGYR